MGLWFDGLEGSPGFGNGVNSASFQISGKVFVRMILLISVVNGSARC